MTQMASMGVHPSTSGVILAAVFGTAMVWVRLWLRRLRRAAGGASRR
jgi:hypothetical protein